MGGFCSELDYFPNVTVADYGEVYGANAMKKEIYKRGPIACVVDADPLHKVRAAALRALCRLEIRRRSSSI